MANDISNVRKRKQAESDNGKLKEFLYECLRKWYWFAISLILCLCLGVYKVIITPKVYVSSTSILIKESSSNNNSSTIYDVLSADGIATVSSKLANEMAIFKSPALMREVVLRLGLNVQCSVKGKKHEYIRFGNELPFNIEFSQDCPRNMNFTIIPTASGFKIDGLAYSDIGKSGKSEKSISGLYSRTLSLPAGKIVVTLSPQYWKSSWTYPVSVRKESVEAAMAFCSSRLEVEADDIKNHSDILNISYRDVCPSRAEAILSNLVAVYNEWWLADNDKLAHSTSSFINERLMALEDELGNVDENISEYKSKNRLPDIAEASRMYMNESTELNRKIQDVDNQMYVAKYVRDYLVDPHNEGKLIPVSSGLTDNTLSELIEQFNNTLLQRNVAQANSSDNSHVVRDLNSSLTTMRSGIISAVDNLLQTLRAKKKVLMKNEREINRSIADSPNQEKYLLSVERQQKVKESLYIFLLQKREENELSKAFTACNTKVITPPMTSLTPVEPQKSEILLLAFLIGMLLPLAIIYFRTVSNTKLRGYDDIEKLDVPFVGEIPFHNEKGDTNLVVKEGSRNLVNEAFRMLRTKLEFINTNNAYKVICTTSFNLGSGKTFTAINLAAANALNGKKVLAIDGDLRKSTLSKLVGKPANGIVHYLASKTDDLDSLIVPMEGYGCLDVLPTGHIPPNPAELLANGRFATALEILRSRYDYIIVDCPPIDAVADTQLINGFCDRTVFIIRAGLLERSLIPEIQKMYDGNVLSGMVVLLNATEVGTGKYGHKYGYRYGRKYGYNSRYYYSYNNEKGKDS